MFGAKMRSHFDYYRKAVNWQDVLTNGSLDLFNVEIKLANLF